MSKSKFQWTKFARQILIFPAAILGIFIWGTVADFLPQVGPELYLDSMYPPDHLYNVYLDSFMVVFVGLISCAFMAPECRREVVVVGILMMGGWVRRFGRCGILAESLCDAASRVGLVICDERNRLLGGGVDWPFS